MRELLDDIQSRSESWKPEEILRWAFATFGDDVAMATGFGVEGMALIDIAARINPEVKVFTGDTEFLFPETYDLIDRVEKRYGIKVERLYSSLTPDEQAREYGPELWKRNPDRCCTIRKIEPLKTSWPNCGLGSPPYGGIRLRSAPLPGKSSGTSNFNW